MIVKFYDEQVDRTQNKLFQACFAYLNSDWFKICCEIGSKFNSSVVNPIKHCLGIDEHKEIESADRSWTGIRKCFNNILSELSSSSVVENCMTGKQILEANVCLKVHTALKT